MNYIQKDGQYLVKFDKGEEVVSTLTEFLAEQNLSSGWVSGLGGLQTATIGYFDQTAKQYFWQEISGNLELANLTGNIASLDSKPFMHLHASISDESLNCKAGHLKSAVVGGTVELLITPLSSMELTRQKDEQSGLSLLDL